MSIVEVKIPDIGDFEDVEVIELLVSAGDRVAVEDSLITIESDKASMEIPAPQATLGPHSQPTWPSRKPVGAAALLSRALTQLLCTPILCA